MVSYIFCFFLFLKPKDTQIHISRDSHHAAVHHFYIFESRGFEKRSIEVEVPHRK